MVKSDSRQAKAFVKRLGLSYEQLLSIRFSINVAIAGAVVWETLRYLGDSNPIWAIASMVAASDPQPEEARRMFRARLLNVLVGCATGFTFLILGGAKDWVVPIAMAVTVLVSANVVRITTMWRQAPITAALILAAGIAQDSRAVGVLRGLHKVAEVAFGSLSGVTVSLLMSRVWLIQSPPKKS